MFKALLARAEDLGFSLDPLTVHLDFELPTMNAVHMVFGSHVECKGCFYHLTQSTWRKVQELGLATLYKNDQHFKHFCGMLDGLAFLPVDEVKVGLVYPMENASDDANNLIDYFNSTYVNGHFRTISRPMTSGEMSSQVKLRHIPPRYPPHLWNMYDATLAGDDRTNNICESWNHGFNSAVGHRHPSLWRLITHLKEDEAQVRLEILQAARGLPPSKRVRKC